MAEEFTVQGQAASSLEWTIAQALEILKYQYDFQVPIRGGRVVGGQVVDFFVYTPPTKRPLMANGAYWHTGERTIKDDLHIHDLIQMGFRPIVVEEPEALTVEQAVITLQRKGL
jgi:hypothetical protein